MSTVPTRVIPELAGRHLHAQPRWRLRSDGEGEIRHSYQVVAGSHHQEPGPIAVPASEAELAATGDGLGPPKDLLDPLPVALAEGVARVPGGACVDSAAPVAGVLGHVGCDLELMAIGDEAASVEPLVTGHRPPPPALRVAAEEEHRRLPLGIAGGLAEFHSDHQSVAVLHQRVPGVAELGLPAVALASQQGLGVGDRAMGGIAALLAMEIHLGVTTAAGTTLPAPIPRPEALQRCPGLQQRAVDVEVIIGDVATQPCLLHDDGEEVVGDIVFQQPCRFLEKLL